jgi:hypothetical protein
MNTQIATREVVQSTPQFFAEKAPTAWRFARAVRTLARPAQSPACSRGSTDAQRTAARFALLELMVSGELSNEERKYVYGAFKHAFEHHDVAPNLLKAIRCDCAALDFSAVCDRKVADFAAEASARKRADAEKKRLAKRERDRQERANRKGMSVKGSGRKKG